VVIVYKEEGEPDVCILGVGSMDEIGLLGDASDCIVVDRNRRIVSMTGNHMKRFSTEQSTTGLLLSDLFRNNMLSVTHGLVNSCFVNKNGNSQLRLLYDGQSVTMHALGVYGTTHHEQPLGVCILIRDTIHNEATIEAILREGDTTPHAPRRLRRQRLRSSLV
jgi:hypothetical protein